MQGTRNLIMVGGLALSFGATLARGQAQRPLPSGIPPAQQGEAAEIARDAQAALRQGDAEGAIRGYEKLVKMAPGVAEFHSNLGMAYYTSGRPAQAVPEFKQALKLKPGLASASFFLGMSLAESGDCSAAISCLSKDYPRAPEPQLKRELGLDGVRCAMTLRQLNQAVDFLRLLNRDFPNDPDVLYMTVHVYSEISNAASQHLLMTAPGSFQAHQLNAEVLEMQGKTEDAIAEYRQVLSLNPRVPGVHLELGRLLLAQSREPASLEAARKEFEAELEVDPGNPAPAYELGEMARQARQWQPAIEDFSRAVKIDPDYAEALIGLGKSLVAAGRAQEAVAPLERVVRLEPQNPVAHYQLSFAYRRVGRDPEAAKELAAYRQTYDQAAQERAKVRAGILGRMTQEQTADPPE